MLQLQISLRQGALLIEADLSLEARVTALFGPSGAGKSSILQCIAGLRRPDSGSIALDGRMLFSTQQRIDLPPEKRRIGCIFQDTRLFPHLSVRHNLEYGIHARRLRRDPGRESAVIDLLGLGPLFKRSPYTLSGGEQQRVAIARAVLTNPDLLLLDEPLASLDLPRRLDVLEYMRRLRDALPIAMLYVSHDSEEVLMLADEVVCIEQGKIVAKGLPETTLAVPVRSWALRARGASSLLHAVVAALPGATGLTVLDHPAGALKLPGLRLAKGSRIELRVDPLDVILSRTAPQGLSVRNVLLGNVISINDLDAAQALVKLSMGTDVIESIVTREAVKDLELQAGGPIYALIKATAIDLAGASPITIAVGRPAADE